MTVALHPVAKMILGRVAVSIVALLAYQALKNKA